MGAGWTAYCSAAPQHPGASYQGTSTAIQTRPSAEPWLSLTAGGDSAYSWKLWAAIYTLLIAARRRSHLVKQAGMKIVSTPRTPPNHPKLIAHTGFDIMMILMLTGGQYVSEEHLHERSNIKHGFLRWLCLTIRAFFHLFSVFSVFSAFSLFNLVRNHHK